MSNKQTVLYGILMYTCSLFAQVFHWALYEKLKFSSGLLLVTPLVLCMLYHFIRRDCGENKQFSYVFIFCTLIILPLITGLGVLLLIWINNPQLFIFNITTDYTLTLKDLIALYSGRIAITSLYLLIFSAINRFIISPMIEVKLKK